MQCYKSLKRLKKQKIYLKILIGPILNNSIFHRNLFHFSNYSNNHMRCPQPHYFEIYRLYFYRIFEILLITSSGHMRRSIACFEKQGVKVDYLCSNRHSGPRKFEFQHCFIPNMSAFNGWAHLLHEVAGYTVYKLTGKI